MSRSASGQVDAIVIASPSAAVLMKNVPDTYKVVGSIGEFSYLAWVVRPEDKDLRDFINAKDRRVEGQRQAQGTAAQMVRLRDADA